MNVLWYGVIMPTHPVRKIVQKRSCLSRQNSGSLTLFRCTMVPRTSRHGYRRSVQQSESTGLSYDFADLSVLDVRQ